MVREPPRIRDLDWANLWERGLARDRRSRIKRAVRRGDVLDDPVDAALAAEYARRQTRPLRVQLPLNAFLLAFFVPVVFADWQAYLRENALPWFTMAWAVVAAAVAFGVVVFFRGRVARRRNLPHADLDAMHALLEEHRRTRRSSRGRSVR